MGVDVTEHATKSPLSKVAHVRTGTTSPQVLVRRLGAVNYATSWKEMKRYTAERTGSDADQLWLLQHPPVYTLGLAARAAHLPRSDTQIPVVKTDRGGQITYHGPGQIVAYTLVDLRRLGIGVRQLVRRLEQSVIDLLHPYGIEAHGRERAPGVYVGEAKIAALGLRIRNGCSYHGLSLNVDMDLGPFTDIDPCGYPGLRVSQLRDLGISDDIATIGDKLLAALQSNLWPTSTGIEIQ
ncbi:MAG: lipoyl(octanoyl) transferase LipB [Betaproteobacteria bacterium]|nr:MAG: lipoyl(octanoyl) transferase LipB [Betaproteobacteria bacterium]